MGISNEQYYDYTERLVEELRAEGYYRHQESVEEGLAKDREMEVAGEIESKDQDDLIYDRMMDEGLE